MNNILLISSESLFEKPTATLQRIFQFVGVESKFEIENLKPRNVARNRTQIDSEVYEYSIDYFHPHNQALYELSSESYGW
jgi:hypothetical protein